MILRALLLALLVGLSAPAVAVTDDLTPEQAERYHDLLEELRCLVCQNQNLAESHASLALDLKRQVADMIVDGRSDDEIKSYLQARYGDFVLYRPPFKPRTWLLWLTPFVVLLCALVIAVLMLRRRRPVRTPPESIDREALQRLLDDE